MIKRIFFTLFFLGTILNLFAQDPYLEKGNTYMNNGEFNKAEETFKEAIRSDSNNLIYQCQLGLNYIQAKRFKEGQQALEGVLRKSPDNAAAIWYSGIGYFYNKSDRDAIARFEQVLPMLNPQSGQYYSAHWFIATCYANLLKTEGLTYEETDKMFASYEEYLRLQPDAEDAQKIRDFLANKKEKRPPNNVKLWIDK